MYKQVEPESIPGWSSKPITTLKDEYGGIIHIVIDDGCYLCLLKSQDGTFKPITHIFPELYNALVNIEIKI